MLFLVVAAFVLVYQRFTINLYLQFNRLVYFKGPSYCVMWTGGGGGGLFTAVFEHFFLCVLI